MPAAPPGAGATPAQRMVGARGQRAGNEVTGESSGGWSLPARLRAGIHALSGVDLSDVRVHANSAQPERLDALAYARGNQIHLARGQEQHLPHEAWHLVQQRQGRVQARRHVSGVPVADDVGLEREADTMGARALQAPLTGAAELAGGFPLSQGTAAAAPPTAAAAQAPAQLVRKVKRSTGRVETVDDDYQLKWGESFVAEPPPTQAPHRAQALSRAQGASNSSSPQVRVPSSPPPQVRVESASSPPPQVRVESASSHSLSPSSEVHVESAPALSREAQGAVAQPPAPQVKHVRRPTGKVDQVAEDYQLKWGEAFVSGDSEERAASDRAAQERAAALEARRRQRVAREARVAAYPRTLTRTDRNFAATTNRRGQGKAHLLDTGLAPAGDTDLATVDQLDQSSADKGSSNLISFTGPAPADPVEYGGDSAQQLTVKTQKLVRAKLKGKADAQHIAVHTSDDLRRHIQEARLSQARSRQLSGYVHKDDEHQIRVGASATHASTIPRRFLYGAGVDESHDSDSDEES